MERGVSGGSGRPRRGLIEVSPGEVLVGVDAAIPKEGPMGAAGVDLGQVAGGDHDLVAGAALDQQPAAGIGDEAAAPELDPAAGLALVPYPVDRADVDPV